jgi:hypothetical protein
MEAPPFGGVNVNGINMGNDLRQRCALADPFRDDAKTPAKPPQ